MILMQILNKLKRMRTENCSDFRRCLVFAMLKRTEYCTLCVSSECYFVKYISMVLHYTYGRTRIGRDLLPSRCLDVKRYKQKPIKTDILQIFLLLHREF